MSRVIPAKDLGYITDAMALFAEAQTARASADAMVRQAVAAARETARAEGYAAGVSEGRRVLADRLAETSKRAETALLDLEKPIHALVLQIVEKIVHEIPEAIRVKLLVQRALRDLAYPGPIKLHVPTEAAEDLGAHIAKLDARLVVISDPLLRKEELVIEVLGGRMHIGLPDQLANLGQSLAHV